jgi:hypothetical protein
MKKFNKIVMASVALVFGLAATASAGGACQQEPCLDSISKFVIGGSALSGGFFATDGGGTSGDTVVQSIGQKEGFAKFEVGLTGEGAGCAPNCADLNWKVDAATGELSQSMLEVSGPGGVYGINEQAAFGNISLETGKLNIPSQ